MKKTEDLATLEELAKMKRKISPDREIILPVSLANVDSRLGLFFAPEKHEGWVNLYKGMVTIILVVRFLSVIKRSKKIYREELWLCRHN